MIPFLDIAAINNRQAEELANTTRRVIHKGSYILGQEVAKFEQEFADYCGVYHCIGVANGLDALTLILRAAIINGDLKTGDGIIIPANTYIATVLAVTHAGLSPILVEPDDTTFNLSVDKIIATAEQKTTKIRALLAVHLYGQVAPMEELQTLCYQRDWLLFEDAAQAHGAIENGARVGGLSNAAGFSFYPSKNLGALGDGGAITTNNNTLAQTIRALSNYGSKQKYYNQYIGVNSRLDELQAALLRVKLPLLDDDNACRRSIATRYLTTIKNPVIQLPKSPKDPLTHVWHLFVIRCSQRQALIIYLAKKGIDTMIHYPVPPHQQPAYANSPIARYELPLTNQLATEVLSLPISPVLTDKQINTIISTINAFSP